MDIVSLDQNFLWNFATGRLPGFVKLHESLRRAVTEGRAVCPLHVEETVFESSMLEAELRGNIHRIAEELSQGCAFHPFGVVIGFMSLQLVRPGFDWPFLRRVDSLHQASNTEGAMNRDLKRNYKERLKSLPYPPPSYEPGDDLHTIEEGLVTERSAFMYRMLGAIVEKRSLETGKEQWEHTNLAGRVLLDMEITNEESTQLREAILQRKWDALDIMHVHNRLCALLESDGLRCARKTDPNDAWDLSRLAVGLTQAEVVCCDRAMGSLIERSKLCHPEHGSVVFTSKQIDAATVHIDSLPWNKIR